MAHSGKKDAKFIVDYYGLGKHSVPYDIPANRYLQIYMEVEPLPNLYTKRDRLELYIIKLVKRYDG